MTASTAARPRRTRREWTVDLAAFLLAAAFGVFGAVTRNEATASLVPAWVPLADQVIGALGCAALWLHRRWPFQLALVVSALSAVSTTIGGASAVAQFAVALRRPPREIAVVTIVGIAASPVYAVLRPDADISVTLMASLGTAITLAVLGWALFVRHRRQLIASLRDRASRAETEARLRAEQAQAQAREQIAREMHDVLGHRLSLLSVHAGALEYRRDASPAEIAAAASVIRSSAHQALQELRSVIGVLRAPVGGELPLPTLVDAEELIAESRRAGMRVTSRWDITDSTAMTDVLGRTAYRIVQEGLTNARKHAPAAAVTVHLSGAPGSGLTVEVHNGGPAGGPADSGSGSGLIGLAERASLAGGYLAHQRGGADGGGGWCLWAWLPWEK
ncbi:sensor histidine kinase [Pseudonocardia spinosispora]|uniref:sensor histidine kinase n=1 Tax=Pseudonocardia spinosispora TaxID=103441 RepID=UPI000408786D|nr:histidine kinase [Pseudonocardia spinosispora]